MEVELAPLASALAATLLHFIWQGALIAGALAAVGPVLRRSAPVVRYLSACFAMLLMVATVAVSFGLFYRSYAAELAVLGQSTGQWTTSLGIEQGAGYSVQHLVLGAWALGVCALLLRLFGGWLHLRRTLGHTYPLSGSWQRWAVRLARTASVRWSVRFAQTAGALVPQVIGWLRPVIVLPAVALTRLSPEQLETLILHELAHVRRFDVLVNLVQSLVEALLFYHPAVWWVSRRMRIEREYCCDAWVLAQRSDPLTYARALTEVESWRLRAAGPSVAATDGSLRDRIMSVISPPSRSARCGRRVAGLRLGAAAALLLALASTSALFICAHVTSRPVLTENAIASPLRIPWLPAPLQRFANHFQKAAVRHGVDPEMLAIVSLVESGGFTEAVSSAGAVGLMQIMPATGRDIAARRGIADHHTDKLRDPAYNIDFGAWYLARQLETFGTDDEVQSVGRAAAAYNGGPGRLRRHLDTRAQLPASTERYRRWVRKMWLERRRPNSGAYDSWLAAGGHRLLAQAAEQMSLSETLPFG